MIEWATDNAKAVRQRSVRQENTLFKAGTLPLNMYRNWSTNYTCTEHYPKDIVSFSLNTIEEETVTSPATVTTITPCTSHETIKDDQLVEETEVEEEEEYETGSDAEYSVTDNDEEDSLDDLVFLRAVTTRSGRMVRVVQRE